MINVKDCFTKGLLKKVKKDVNLAKKDLKQAEFFLNEAMELEERKHMFVLALYNSFFHVIRALLFKDGIKERSHYCMLKYFEKEYVNKKQIDLKFLNAFDKIMGLRHEVQYSTEKVEIDEDLVELANICEELIEKVEVLL